jgi:hypothetical protein
VAPRAHFVSTRFTLAAARDMMTALFLAHRCFSFQFARFPMIRLLLGSVVAALVMFGWSAYYWLVLANQVKMIQPLPDNTEAQIIGALKDIESSAVYYYPKQFDGEDKDAWNERHKEGPIIMIQYRPGGLDAMSWRVYAAGFVHMLAACFLLGVILKFAAHPGWSYLTRAAFCLFVGVFASVLIDPNWVVWFHQDVKFHHYNGIYHVGAVLFAGLVLAAFIKARPATA